MHRCRKPQSVRLRLLPGLSSVHIGEHKRRGDGNNVSFAKGHTSMHTIADYLAADWEAVSGCVAPIVHVPEAIIRSIHSRSIYVE